MKIRNTISKKRKKKKFTLEPKARITLPNKKKRLKNKRRKI